MGEEGGGDGGRKEEYPILHYNTGLKAWSIILSGANGAGKTILTLQAASRIMKEGRRCIYVITTMSPKSLIETASSISIDLGEFIKKELFVIVDCYSRFTGTSSMAKYTLGPESNLLQLRETILTAANDVITWS